MTHTKAKIKDLTDILVFKHAPDRARGMGITAAPITGGIIKDDNRGQET